MGREIAFHRQERPRIRARHQHFNASATKPARALVLKSKPMMMFMNLLFQKTVIPRPAEATPEGKGFVPRHFEENLNHAD